MKRIIFALLLLGLASAMVACDRDNSGAPGTLPTQVPSPSPSPRPSWTPTRAAPTATNVPPSATPVPPSATPVPPTATLTPIGVIPGATSRSTLSPNPVATSTPVATLVLPNVVTLTTPITGTVVVGAGHKLNVREAPSTSAEARNELQPGWEVHIVGKTLDEKWLQIDTPAAGWISSSYVAVSGTNKTITGQVAVAGGYQSNGKVDTGTKVEYVEEPFVSSGNLLIDLIARMIHRLLK